MHRALAWAVMAPLIALAPSSARAVDTPIEVRIGWQGIRPTISLRAGESKLPVGYDVTGNFYHATAPIGTREIWVVVFYEQQGPRAPDSFRIRLVPREPVILLSVPRPPPLPNCNQPAVDRIGQHQPDYHAAFWFALEARELLRRPTTQRGFCGGVMRPRMRDAFDARQRDMAKDFRNASPPLFPDE
jgi:hypothetical protein